MKSISRTILLIILLALCSDRINAQETTVNTHGNSEGKVKDSKGRTIITFSEEGIVKDINEDVIFSINTANGNIKDGNNDHIGKIVNNQILDWDNNVLYTLSPENKILDINAAEVGSIDPVTMEIKNYAGEVIGSYSDTEPIYVIYYYFKYSFY